MGAMAMNSVTRMFIVMVLLLPVAASADAPAATSRSAVTAAPAASTAAGSTAELGKVEVTGTKPLVEILQQMKTAINAPFTNDPKHYDDMVCRIENNEGFRAQGVVLDCGTQGYYSMRREIMHRDMQVTEDVAAAGTPTLGHPWHIVRLLNHEQVAALRKVLGKLPEPGKGDVEVLDDPTPSPAPATH